MSSPTSIDYEQLGLFYLGRLAGQPAPVLLQSRQLTTHAVVLGMTGSGKTGLSLSMLEEAAIDGIPILAIDPKGDLGNLALTFPNLTPTDFLPWIDPEEARRNGRTVEEQAAVTATGWKEGLAKWGQGPDRIERLRAANEVRIYTPGSRAGVPLAMLRDLAPPGGDDEDLLRERVVAAVSGLLGLLGIEADPLQSREHVLLSRLLTDAWTEGQTVDLAWLIGAVQRPPFERIGVLDLEAFFPANARAALSMAMNNLLASPGAAAWLEGEPLDIASMLYGPDGRPRTSIVSIAHLGDAERMFVVSSILGAMVSWMRSQSGTSSLRALLFMDEVFGYLPPTANPPSKPPMLTLLKQARAFGLGVVLATQNPVDLDYKALANCGTWFLGRMQTDRDRARVLDGLESAATTGFDRPALERTLSQLAPRHFVLHSVHEAAPRTFETRWALSFLRGPITREEIKRLTRGAAGAAPARSAAPSPATTPMAPRSAGVPVAAAVATGAPGGGVPAGLGGPPVAAPAVRPAVPAGLEERFSGTGTCTPAAFVRARLHYVDTKLGVDGWEELTLAAPFVDDDRRIDWDSAEPIDAAAVTSVAPRSAGFAPLPAWLSRKGAATDWDKRFAAWVLQARPIRLQACPSVGVTARPGEAEAAFRGRVTQALREARDTAITDLKAKAAPKLAAAEAKVRKAEARLAKESAEASAANLDTVATWGGAIFGAIFGGGSAVTKVTRAARTTTRNLARQEGVTEAQAAVDEAKRALETLSEQIDTDLAQIAANYAPNLPQLSTVEVRARKADTQVLALALLWQGASSS